MPAGPLTAATGTLLDVNLLGLGFRVKNHNQHGGMESIGMSLFVFFRRTSRGRPAFA